MITYTITCDICGDEIPPNDKRFGLKLGQIICELRPTSQSAADSFGKQKVHTCATCLRRVLADGTFVETDEQNAWPNSHSDSPFAGIREILRRKPI